MGRTGNLLVQERKRRERAERALAEIRSVQDSADTIARLMRERDEALQAERVALAQAETDAAIAATLDLKISDMKIAEERLAGMLRNAEMKLQAQADVLAAAERGKADVIAAHKRAIAEREEDEEQRALALRVRSDQLEEALEMLRVAQVRARHAERHAALLEQWADAWTWEREQVGSAMHNARGLVEAYKRAIRNLTQNPPPPPHIMRAFCYASDEVDREAKIKKHKQFMAKLFEWLQEWNQRIKEAHNEDDSRRVAADNEQQDGEEATENVAEESADHGGGDQGGADADNG